MLQDFAFNPPCSRCGQRMGQMSEDEFVAIVMDKGDCGVCFNCDEDSAASTPSVFWQWQAEDVFIIGGQMFIVSHDDKGLVLPDQSHAHERTRTRVLSSYTYLNKNLTNSVVSSNWEELGACPECQGSGLAICENESFVCLDCGGQGVRVRAIFLPPWILGLEYGNV